MAMSLQFDLKKNPQQLALVILGGTALGIILYAGFVVRIQVVELFSLLIKTGRVSANIRTAQADIASLPRYQAEIGQFNSKVDLYEQKLPVEREIPSILENLSATAKRYNITILGITPMPAPAAPKGGPEMMYQEFPILISAKSGYNDLRSFLHDLEFGGRFIKVVDIGVRSNKSTPKKHDVEIMVSTYILLKKA